MTASIVGWAHTPFGKFDAETVEGLVTRVANEALADAGLTPDVSGNPQTPRKVSGNSFTWRAMMLFVSSVNQVTSLELSLVII